MRTESFTTLTRRKAVGDERKADRGRCGSGKAAHAENVFRFEWWGRKGPVQEMKACLGSLWRERHPTRHWHGYGGSRGDALREGGSEPGTEREDEKADATGGGATEARKGWARRGPVRVPGGQPAGSRSWAEGRRPSAWPPSVGGYAREGLEIEQRKQTLSLGPVMLSNQESSDFWWNQAFPGRIPRPGKKRDSRRGFETVTWRALIIEQDPMPRSTSIDDWIVLFGPLP